MEIRTKIWTEKLSSEMNMRYYGTMITWLRSTTTIIKWLGALASASGPTTLLMKSVPTDTSRQIAIISGYTATAIAAALIPATKYSTNLKKIRDRYCTLQADWEKMWLRHNAGETISTQEIAKLITKKGDIAKDEGNVPRIEKLVIYHQKKTCQANGV